MSYQDEEFSSNNNPRPSASAATFVDPQQLVQLLIAAKAAQQVGQAVALAQNAAVLNAGGAQGAAGQLPASPQTPRAFVLSPTDPFAAGAGPQALTPAPQPDPSKAAAILSARQAGVEAQANPQVVSLDPRAASRIPRPGAASDVTPNLRVADPQQLRTTLGGLMRGISGPENPPVGVLPDGSLVRDVTYLAKAPSRIFPQNAKGLTQDGNRDLVPQQQAPSYDSTSGTARGTTVTLTRTQYGADPNMGGTTTTETRSGTHAFRDNNPGNIEYGDFAKANGAVGQDGRFAIFPTSEAGFRALANLLTGPSYRNLTVDAAIARYAPPSENDTAAYQAAVRTAIGVPGATRLSSLTAVQLERMTQAIARIEGFTRQGTVRTETRLIPNYP